MLPQSDTEWITEAELSERLNVPRKTLREHRSQLSAEAWKIAGGGVLWKKTAAKRAALALSISDHGLDEKDAPAGNGDAETPSPAGAEETLTVCSDSGNSGHHFPNPRVIKARRANGEMVIVNVVDSSKYTRVMRNGQPMTFQARKSPDGNWWRLTGREPRFRGQW